MNILSSKFYLLNVLVVLFFSCNKNETTVLDILDAETNGDLKPYVEYISIDYKNLLFEKYNTQNEKVLIDSMKEYKKDLYEAIKNGKMVLTNHILAEEKTIFSNTVLIKYRVDLYDIEKESRVYRDKIIIKESTNSSFKVIPYEKVFTPNIDSLIQKKYDSDLLIKINDFLKFKSYSSNDSEFVGIKNRFESFIKCIKTEDLRFMEFIYPPALKLIAKQEGIENFDKSENKKLAMKLILEKRKSNLIFKEYYIEDFYKINCENKNLYFIKYAIEVKPNIYIPGKILVVLENNQLYFIEYNDKNFKEELPNLFEQEIMNCIELENKK